MIVLSSSLVAALWGWRLEAVKTDRLKRDVDIEQTKAAKWAELYDHKCKDLIELSKKHAQSLKWDIDKNEELEKVRGDYKAMVKNCSDLVDRIEQLRNEIDGLNVDKLALWERLQKYEAAEEKRRAQKRAGMQRYRANKKKGAKK